MPIELTVPKEDPRVATGVPGLDAILGGGLTRDRIYLIEGTPGSGKTTLALQFLLKGRELGETGLYITLSETETELRAAAASHGWSLDGIDLFELVSEEGLDPDSEQSVLHPSDVELGETTRAVMRQVEASRPMRVVFDSLSEMRLLAQNPLRHRRQILALKHFFATRNCTVLLLDDQTAEDGDLQAHRPAPGIFAQPAIGSAARRGRRSDRRNGRSAGADPGPHRRGPLGPAGWRDPRQCRSQSAGVGHSQPGDQRP